MGRRGKGRGGRQRKRKKIAANKADKYELYQKSVQEPDCDVEFFEMAYQDYYSGSPTVLREDFCGTAAVCCAWVKSDSKRTAMGFDLDPEPLSWGHEHNVGALDPPEQERVRMIRGNALDPYESKADVIAANNFSYFYFKTRKSLLEYFEAARNNLADEGILVLDIVGGSEVLEEGREEITEYDDFDYIWEQHSFNPITADQVCHIHFRFPDGSKMKRAFTYEWRLWTIPEVRELLLDAGFKEAHVYWEGSEPDSDEGNGEFERTERAESELAWIAYVVGVK